MAAFLAQVRFQTNSLQEFDAEDVSANHFGALGVSTNEVKMMCEADYHLSEMFKTACEDLQHDVALTKLVVLPSVVHNISQMKEQERLKEQAKIEAQAEFQMNEQLAYDERKDKKKKQQKVTQQLLYSAQQRQQDHIQNHIAPGRTFGQQSYVSLPGLSHHVLPSYGSLEAIQGAIKSTKRSELIGTLEKPNLPAGFAEWSKSRKQIWEIESASENMKPANYGNDNQAKPNPSVDPSRSTISPVVLEVDAAADLVVVNDILDASCSDCSSVKYIGAVSNTQRELFWTTAMFHWTEGTTRTFPSQCGNLNLESDNGLLVPNVTLPLIGNGASNPTPRGFHRISWCIAGGHEDYDDAAKRLEYYRLALRHIDGLDEVGKFVKSQSPLRRFAGYAFVILGLLAALCCGFYIVRRSGGKWFKPGSSSSVGDSGVFRALRSKILRSKNAQKIAKKIAKKKTTSLSSWDGTASATSVDDRTMSKSRAASKKGYDYHECSYHGLSSDRH